MRFGILLLGLLIMTTAAADLQAPADSPIRLYSVADGLNQKTVLSVVQDQDGFLWVATFGGLNRFDGQRFESYTTANGLRQNLIQGLLVDSRNRVWAGDAAGGLTLLEHGKVTRTFEPNDGSRGVVRSIVEVGSSLYIGVQPGGLRKLDLNDLDAGLTVIPGAPEDVLVIAVQSPGEMYLQSTAGLYRFQPHLTPAFELLDENVTALTRGKSGLIVVGDRNGHIGKVTDKGVEWSDRVYPGSVSGFAMRDGTINWVFLTEVGMVPFDAPEATPILPTSGSAPALYDDDGVLWVPIRGGLARYLGDRFAHYSLQVDNVRPEVFSILPGVENDYWFGSSIGLLHVDADGALTNVSDALGIDRREVRDLVFSDDAKTLWAGQVQSALLGIDVSGPRLAVEIGDETTLTVSLELDQQGALWVGSYLGNLTRRDAETGAMREYQLGNGAAIYAMDLAADGMLWFGANYQGIYRLDTNDPNAEPEQVMSVESLGQEFFTQIVAQGQGDETELWFTSISGGVFHWQSDEFRRVLPGAALSDQTVYSIQPLPDNTLVLATSRGVYRFDPAFDQLEQYTALDGFTQIEAKVHANYFDGDKTLWIGTTGGVTRMDVSLPMDGVAVPTPMLTNQFIGDVAFDEADGPAIATDGKVRIEFTAISTLRPSGIEYSYKLHGQDEDWSAPTSNTSIGYSSLKPGDYQFNLRARLAGGEWSAPVSWTFSVPTPFWRSAWFIVLVVVSGAGITWSVIQLRLRAIAKTNQRLRAEVAERTRSIEAGRRELEQINQQLSSEIHERKLADALRADVEARFHQAYQNSPIGMALVDTDGIVYDANPRMRSLFWPQSGDSDGEPLLEIVEPEFREQFTGFFDRFVVDGAAREDNERPHMEVDCIANSGELRRIDFHPSAVRDQNGQLKYIVLLAHDVTDSRAMTRQLEYQANFDELTGLVNRRAFSEQLALIAERPAGQTDAYLMFLDLDQFKIVNDTCGHAAGDALLQQVASLISSCVRDGDTVARLGGDEFALIINECTEAVALQRAERVRSRIEELEFVWDTELFRVGVSIGVVPIDSVVQDLNELQQLADAACYAAKEAGRNRVHMVGGDGDAAHEHRGEMRWVQRLNHAIDHNNFRLYGQRIVSLSGGSDQPERIEVLLRMYDRTANRLIPPGAFLPAAERYGLQGRLDQWVLRNVIDVLAAQDPAEVANQEFWVNLSGATVGDASLAKSLIQTVEQADLPRGAINFEITETAVIRKIDDAIKLIQALREMGCRFALDDFGSGLSSFGYLKRLNVDCLKIDGQFVRDITTDPTDRIFVKSIIDIAHTLDMRIVAEFVEDEEILKLVQTLGSDYAQGFGIHRPEPLDGMITLTTAIRNAGLLL
ncbi:MAG: EAL domain-containing protein [Pseudomonadota bacterium]